MMIKAFVLYGLAVLFGLCWGGTVGRKLRQQRLKERIASSETKLYAWLDQAWFKLGVAALGLLLLLAGWRYGHLEARVGIVFLVSWVVCYWRLRRYNPYRQRVRW
jgi:hypothetical protein